MRSAIFTCCTHVPEYPQVPLIPNRAVAKLLPSHRAHQTPRGNVVVVKHGPAGPESNNRDLPLLSMNDDDMLAVDEIVRRPSRRLVLHARQQLPRTYRMPACARPPIRRLFFRHTTARSAGRKNKRMVEYNIVRAAPQNFTHACIRHTTDRQDPCAREATDCEVPLVCTRGLAIVRVPLESVPFDTCAALALAEI
ncbi:hypothetical protein B0H13DRAFT_2319842 [Mycena leptocephala]|nr:hypothetical protein B0H13DRAFT_2319842 [Mycena leptocephala]